AVVPEVAVGIEDAQIAGRVEAVAIEHGVASAPADRTHEVAAAYADLAELTGIAYRARFRIDDAHLDALERPAATAALAVGQVAVEARAAVRPERLRHAEEVGARPRRGSRIGGQHRREAGRTHRGEIGGREAGVRGEGRRLVGPTAEERGAL